MWNGAGGCLENLKLFSVHIVNVAIHLLYFRQDDERPITSGDTAIFKVC